MPKSTYLNNVVLNAALVQTSFVPPPVIYVALFTVSPVPSGGGTEVAGSGYGRQTAIFSLSSAAITSSTTDVIFPIATGPWGTIVAFALFDASSGGNMLYFGNLSTSRTILASDQVKFPAGQLICQET